MSLQSFLVSCTLLFLCSGEQSMRAVNSMLDPSRLTWWRTKWAPSPIQLSANNANRAGVTATFYICPSTSVASGVVEVTFPSAFTLPATAGPQVVSGQTVSVTGVTLVAGQDMAVSVVGVKNPSQEGPFGPFAVRTRSSLSGQQMDANLSFGSIYIRPAVAVITGATAAIVGAPASGTVINKSNNIISFKFTISVSLWRFDMFVITADPRWTISPGATCSSADYSGKWNNFNGTTSPSSATPHALQCYITQTSATVVSQSAYIYGLAVDGIDTSVEDNKYVDLRITSVTSPIAQYSGNPYMWTITTYRFGTTTMLEQAIISTGPAVNTDVPGAVTWTPTWSPAVGALSAGLTYFMDMSITLTNPIPLNAGSFLEVSMTETPVTLSGSENWVTGTNCYVATYLARSVVCTVTAKTIRLAPLPALPAATTIKIRNLVQMKASAGTGYISSVKSYLHPDAPIDASTSSSMGAVSINSNSPLAAFNVFPLFGNEGAVISSKTGGLGTNAQAIQFVVSTGAIIDSDTTITIGCPLATTLDDFAIGVPVTTSYSLTDSPVSAVIAFQKVAITVNKPTLAFGTSTTLGILSFKGNIGGMPITTSAHLSLFQEDSASAPFITLPRVATNLATAYECRASASKGETVQVGVARFWVSPQTFIETVTVACRDNINGMPWMFSLVPQVHKIPASDSGVIYYVEFEFQNTRGNFDSGLSVPSIVAGNTDNALDIAVSYPLDKAGTSSTPTAWMYNNARITTYVAVKDIGEIATTSNPARFIFPVGGLTDSAVTPIVRSYYIYVKDPRYKHITHEEPCFTRPIISSTSRNWDVGSHIIQGTAINWETTPTGVTFNLADSSINFSLNQLYFVVFPMGYKFASAATVKKIIDSTNSIAFPIVYTFSSPTWGFKFPGVFFISGTIGNNVNLPIVGDSTIGTLNIGGYQVRPGATNDDQRIKAVYGGDGTSACKAVSEMSLIAAEGYITNISTTPLALKARGPDGINVSHTVWFTLSHGITAGGRIVMIFNSNWLATPCKTCTVSGLPGAAATCEVTDTQITVTGITEFTTPRTEVSVKITGLVAPSVPGNYHFVVAIMSQTPNVWSSTTYYNIDSGINLATTPTNVVTVTAGSDVGRSTWMATKVLIPSTASATAADLHLKFSLTHSLYKTCGLITLTSPYPFKSTTTDCKNFVFFSIPYRSCLWSGSTLTLTLDQDYRAGEYLELFADAAIDNPSTTAASATGFSISATWSVVQVDLDTASSQLKYSATPQPATSIAYSLTFAPKNTGEIATYTFSFKDTAAYATTDQFWIVFPKQYDYFLGDTWQWFSKEPNTYYIDCASTQLGTTWCTVDHGVVVVSGSNEIPGSVEIVLTVAGVVNPAGQTDNFQLYHVDSNGEVKSINQSIGTVTPTPMAGDLGVRSLEQSDRRLFKESDYKWRLYISDVLTTESQLMAQFPKEFDLNKFGKKDSYSCSTTYQDISSTATDKSQRSWNPASACSASKGWATLPAPATQITFTNTNIVTWTLQSVVNPQWGMPRSQLDMFRDYDVRDATLWPLDPLWASRFSFFVYQSVPAKYTTRSYQNTNAAYAGFTRGYRQILVNDYNPLSKANRIVVYAGTQTKDISISTESAALPMAAKQIVFTPSTNSRTPDSGKLKYTSPADNWTLTQSFDSIKFRVAAAHDMTKGLYYIDWANNETKQSGLSEMLYDTPASTLLEVVALVPGYSQLTVSAIPSISTGSMSVPVKIAASLSPHSDVTVNIAIKGAPADVSVTPTAVTFSPDVDTKYFQVQVASTYNPALLGETQTLLFSLTGADKDTFTISATAQISITQSSNIVLPGTIQTFGITGITRTTAKFHPSTDQYGILYYQIASKGTLAPSFSSLKSIVTALVGADLTTANSADGVKSETDPQAGESWRDFQWRLYRVHLSAVWVGAVPIYETTSVQFTHVTWLWAGTDYQISGYLDNLSAASADPPMKIEYFTTKPTPEYQPIVVKFAGKVGSSFLAVIALELSVLIGVNPLRMDGGTFASSPSRALQAAEYSSFSYNFLPDRFSEVSTPAEQSKLSSTQVTTLETSLKTAGINNTLAGLTNPSPITKAAPTWTHSPASGGSTTDSVTVTVRANVAGQTCCIATTDYATPPTSEQVILGLDGFNQPTHSACIDTDLGQTSNSVQVAGLEEGATYYVYCSAVDSYPLWPTHMLFSSTDPIQPVSIATVSKETEDNSGGRHLGGLFLLLLLH